MSGSHAYGGDCPGLPGVHHYGGGGLGILGSLIAAGGYIYSSLTLPADANKEYYGPITAIPAGLTIDTGEAGDFDASALDGSYAVPWDLYEFGVKLGSTNFTCSFGTGAVINLAISNLRTAATLSTASVGVVPLQGGGGTPATINLVAANLASAASLSTLAVSVAATAFNHIIFTLQTQDDIPLPNLANLKWALCTQGTQNLLGAIIAQGVGVPTDASGGGSIAVPASSVPIGRYWLILTNSDGTTTQNPAARAVSCPVMVV